MPIKAEQEFVEEIKRRYVGKWIGAKGKEVVAVFDSHEELIKEIKKKGLDNVYVFYSPSGPYFYFGFWLALVAAIIAFIAYLKYPKVTRTSVGVEM
jgi:hypothetical protein